MASTMHITQTFLTQGLFLDNIKLIIKAIFHFRKKVNIPGKNINAH